MAKRFRTVIDPDLEIFSNKDGLIKGPVVKRICDTPEEFVKIYLNAIGDMIKLDHRMFQILMMCLKESNFCDDRHPDGNVIYNFTEFKDKCIKAIGDDKLTYAGINQIMYRLASLGILIRKSRGTFMLNPKLFIKGQTPKALVVTTENI